MQLSRLLLLLLAAAAGCSQTPSSQPGPGGSPKPASTKIAQAGGIYSCKSGEGEFTIVKVLVVEPGVVHVRLYKNQYQERPTSIDPKELQVSIGHAPLAENGFRNWEPVLLLEQPVADDELVGYRLWRDQ